MAGTKARGWMFTLGLCALGVLAATVASTVGPSADEVMAADSDPCFKYGRFECCLRPD